MTHQGVESLPSLRRISLEALNLLIFPEFRQNLARMPFDETSHPILGDFMLAERLCKLANVPRGEESPPISIRIDLVDQYVLLNE